MAASDDGASDNAATCVFFDFGSFAQATDPARFGCFSKHETPELTGL